MRLPSSPKHLHHGLLHLALALLLLLTQQLVLRHALEHEADPDHHAAHSQCLSCLAAHALDHATSGTPSLSLPVCDAVASQVAGAVLAAPAVTVVAHRARGPPAFLA